MAIKNPRPNPYVGPRAFKTGEKLHGRNRELSELRNLLIAERIVLLYSPSGAGKSSLVYAGLIPALIEEGFQVLPVSRVNLEPPKNLASTEGFNRYVYSVLASFDEALPEKQRMPLKELAKTSLQDYLENFKIPSPAVAQGIEDMPPMEAEVLIFDQFEEILTTLPTDLEGKSAFFTQLGAALRDRRRWALFVMREDYIAALDPYLRPIPTRLRNTFRLDLLGAGAALDAIKLPPAQHKVTFTEDAARQLVDDLRRVQVQRPDGSMEIQPGPHVEPVQLQVVCFRLWQNLSADDREITVEDVAQVGDVNESLGEYYAEKTRSVSQETGVTKREIRVWFDEKLITESGIRLQVLMEPERSGGLDNRAIRMLEDAHLVRAEKRRGTTWFELAHDRLLDPVRASNAAWFQANLSLLQRQAGLWQKENRPSHLLLRDKALQDSEAWAAEHPKELSDDDKDFLKACVEQRTREEEARAAAERERLLKLEAAEKVAEAERLRAEEQAQAAKKLRTRLIMATVAFVAALFFAGAAAFAGFQANETAKKNVFLAGTAQSLAVLAEGNAATARANADEAEAASTQAYAQRATAVAAEQVAMDAQKVALEQKAIAEQNAEEALQQANLANSRQLASLAVDQLNDQSDLALLLSIEAYRKSQTGQALDALLKALQRNLGRELQRSNLSIPPQPVSIVSMASSPDARWLAWGGNAGLIRMYDFELQDMRWEKVSDNTRTIQSLAFSPDGKILASADSKAEIRFWDVADGSTLRIIRPELSSILTLAFSPDGGSLAYGGVAPGNEVNLFIKNLKTNYFTGLSIRPLKSDILHLAWSPDSKLLASAGRERVVRVWDAASGEELQKFEGFEGSVKSVAFSPNGQMLATGANDETIPYDKNILIWDISLCNRPPDPTSQEAGIDPWDDPTCRGQVPVPLIGQDADVSSIAYSADGSLLASGDTSGNTRLWDVRYQELLDQRPAKATGIVSTVIFRQEEDNLQLAVGSLDRTISLNNLRSTDSMIAFNKTFDSPIQAISFLSDNSMRAVGNDQNQTTMWAGDASGEASSTGTFPISSSSYALSKDGRTFALVRDVDGEGVIEIWSSGSAGSLLSIPAPSGTLVSSTELEDGSTISETTTTTLGTVRSLAFSPDGSTIAAGVCAIRDEQLGLCSQNQVYLWQAASGEPITQFDSEHRGAILSLAYSEDGERLASGGGDAAIYLYNVEDGRLLGLPLIGQGGPVTALSFNNDGSRLASGGANSLMALWNVDSAQLIGDPIAGMKNTITAVAFSPDGATLITGNDQGDLAWWRLESWLDLACKYSARNFSRMEWEQFFKGEDYRSTCSEWPAGQ